MRPRIAIIGAGHIAWHLAYRLHTAEWSIDQMVIRTETRRERFRDFPIRHIIQQTEELSSADIFVVCVPDDAIPQVLSKVSPALFGESLWIHMSGSVRSDIFLGTARHFGCLWPVQTLVAGEIIFEESIPVVVMASDHKSLELIQLIGSLFGPVTHVDQEQQKLALHTAAVASGNFSFRIMRLIAAFCKKENVTPALLLPLVRQSLTAGLRTDGTYRQTGPAARGDSRTLDMHRSLLASSPELLAVYNLMTDIIQQQTKEENADYR